MTVRFKIGIALALVLLLACFYTAFQQVKAAAQAYVYGYPLVLMDLTQHALGNGKPINGFTHSREFPDHTFRNVVRPNNDTLYSIAWLDLSAEPVVLSVPDTQGRYYVMPLMDAWTNVFASVGKGSDGTQAGDYLIAGPDWQGTIPDGLVPITSPTNRVWMIGRIQTNGRDDVPAVAQLQDQFQLTPLQRWGSGKPTQSVIGSQDKQDAANNPKQQIKEMNGAEFYARLLRLMVAQPAAPEDVKMLATMASVDLVPGESFSPGVVKAWLFDFAKRVTHEGIVKQLANAPVLENGWSVHRTIIGNYGDHYGVRTGVAMVGLGALPPKEAVYPNTKVDGTGQRLTGAHSYKIHFPAGKAPPAKAFWSVTVYDAEGFLVANPIGRYALGDRDPLIFNPDGSLDLYIQHAVPQQLANNWLPSPEGEFALTMRIYLPGDNFLDGSWVLPAVEQTD
ncbi:MAG: DUF1254 domain-containing protein [Halioglobus sp.]